MAQSQVNLYNMALSAVGADYSVATTSDQTIPVEICNLWYEPVRQTILRAAHWNSAKRYIRMTKEAARESETGYDVDSDADWQSTDPEPGYAFSYELPSNMLAARYLTNFSRFVIGYETAQKILSCNVGGPDADDAPVLCYTVDVTDVTLWEPDLYTAMANGLGAAIGLPLHAQLDRADYIEKKANNTIMQARANTANEMHVMMQQTAERIQARGYSYILADRYVYPYGNLLSNSGASVS